jgi:hypothetical protein
VGFSKAAMVGGRMCHKFTSVYLGIYCGHFQAFLWLIEPDQDVAKISAVATLHQISLGSKPLNVCIKTGDNIGLNACEFKQNVRINSNRLQIQQNFVYMVLLQLQVTFNSVFFGKTY